MKIKPIHTPPPPGHVTGPIQVRIVLKAPNTPRAQGRPMNYTSKSSKWRVMNNNVISWDHIWHAMPPIGPPWANNKNAWDVASSYYGGWELCSCKAGAHDGQTLHRNWNLNRQLLGQAPIDSPIMESQANGIVQGASYYGPPTWSPTMLWIAVALWEAGGYFYILTGDGMGTQPLAVSLAGSGVEQQIPAPRQAATWFGGPANGIVPYCSMSPTGRPWRSDTCRYQHFS